MTVVFDGNGLATAPGKVKVYYFSKETGEYLGWSDEYIPLGVSLPGLSTTIAPGSDSTGYVWLFVNDEWIKTEDHRGEIVYDKETGKESPVSYLGSIHEDFTTMKPSTKYDKYDGEKWVTDTDEQHADQVDLANKERIKKRAYADSEISWLQDAVDSGESTKEEEYLLATWKSYRIKLMRVDINSAPNEVWPELPA